MFNFWKKQQDPRVNHDFSDEDRELAKEKLKAKADIRRLNQKLQVMELEERILDLKDTIQERKGGGSGGFNPEEMIMTLLLKVIEKKQAVGSPTPAAAAAAEAELPKYDFSDEAIREWLGSQKKAYINGAKLMSDVQLKAEISKHRPDIAEKTVDRAIVILRSEF